MLRDRSTRDLYPERSLKYFNRDDGDENDEDLPDNYQFHNEDDEEERSEKEDRERMRNLERTQNKRAERIERLKKESSDVDSPNHVIQNNHHHQVMPETSFIFLLLGNGIVFALFYIYLIVPHAPAFLHSFLLLVTVVKSIGLKHR